MLDTLGLDVPSVGNHEFDEGVPELLRMKYGGCHPTEGCFDASGYPGTKFRYLAANVRYEDGVTPPTPAGAPRYGRWFSAPTGRTVLPPPRSGRWRGSRSASSG
jgi:5'-nucleotidase